MSEHIFVPLAGTTEVRCSCGKEYHTAEEARQHQWWELQLEIARPNQSQIKTKTKEADNEK